MILDINKTFEQIELDILNNEKDIFNLLELYSRKYSYLSDRLNDVNVGLFLNEDREPTVQIFVRNKTGYIRNHLIFNKEGNRVIDNRQLNYKVNA